MLDKITKRYSIGFYLTLVVALVSIIGGALYAGAVLGNETVISYDENFYVAGIMVLALLGGIFAILLLAGSVAAEFMIKDDSKYKSLIVSFAAKLAPWFVFGLNLLGFILLVPNVISIIMFVAQAKSVSQAIADSHMLPPAIVLILAIVAAIVAIFVPTVTGKDETSQASAVSAAGEPSKAEVTTQTSNGEEAKNE